MRSAFAMFVEWQGWRMGEMPHLDFDVLFSRQGSGYQAQVVRSSAGDGQSVTAVAEAPKAMYAVSPIEWATPVLYLRTEGAHLFDIAPQVPQTGAEKPVGSVRYSGRGRA